MTDLDSTVISQPVPLMGADLPAPAGRTEGEELEDMIGALRRSPIFHALLDWLGGHVLVLNRQRQILLASPGFAEELGFEQVSDLNGRRIGEAFGCVHSQAGPDRCGTGKACRYCGALRSILHSQQEDQPVESECRITYGGDGGPESVKYRVRASRAWGGDDDVTVLVLQRGPSPLDGEDRSTRAHDGEWPHGVETYLHLRKLGVGGMGNVYLVRDQEGREFALKSVRAARLEEPEVQRRFRQELQLSVSLHHPNIVRTVEVDRTADGQLFMVSEYCAQGASSQWLQRLGPLPADLAVAWLVGLLRALDYAWREHGVVHRDIKPDNLLVDDDGVIKICDFGIARRADADDPRLTQVGMTLGSVHFMAPEQATGAEVDVRADIYALGSTFFELLSGRPPFQGREPMEILTTKVRKRAPTLRKVRKGLPRKVVAVVDSMLTRERDRRPGQPLELARQLVEIAAAEGLDLAAAPGRYRIPVS